MGASNSSSQQNVTFYQLKAKVDEVNNPFFQKCEKVSNVWTNTDKYDTISGVLSGAEIKEKEYKGQKKNIFVLTFSDDKEVSKIEMTHNSLTYGIINSLASNIDQISGYVINVWKKESNGKWYGNAGVKINNEKLPWSFDPSSAPKKDPVMVDGKQFIQNGVPVYDASKQMAFYENVFKTKIIDKLMPASAKEKAMTSNTNFANENNPNSVMPDDMPF